MIKKLFLISSKKLSLSFLLVLFWLFDNSLALAQFTTIEGRAPPPKVISFTRDLTTASGTTAHTGCGFAPRALINTGGITATAAYNNVTGIVANAGGSGQSSNTGSGTLSIVSANFIFIVDITGGNNQAATVTTWGADGFTLTWVKTGTPTGTATFYVMCLY